MSLGVCHPRSVRLRSVKCLNYLVLHHGVLEIVLGQRHKLAKFNLKPTLGDHQLSVDDRNWRSCDKLTPNNFEISKSADPLCQQCEQDTMSSKTERVPWRVIMKAIVMELGSTASNFFFFIKMDGHSSYTGQKKYLSLQPDSRKPY